VRRFRGWVMRFAGGMVWPFGRCGAFTYPNEPGDSMCATGVAQGAWRDRRTGTRIDPTTHDIVRGQALAPPDRNSSVEVADAELQGEVEERGGAFGFGVELGALAGGECSERFDA
jgi:hypothetical protein